VLAVVDDADRQALLGDGLYACEYQPTLGTQRPTTPSGIAMTRSAAAFERCIAPSGLFRIG